MFTDDEFRKHYGLSFHNHCGDYVKSFKCMTTCKMMGFQVFRMNFKCKCSCHEMKTSTILPFFKWRTNGTTKTVPKTQSARLYDIVGSGKTETEQGYTGINFTCPTFYFPTSTASSFNSSDSEDATRFSSGNASTTFESIRSTGTVTLLPTAATT